MEKISYSPTGGNRENGVASTLKTIAWLIWIIGFILGIVIGRKFGKIGNLGSYLGNYFGSGSNSSDFDFSWTSAFVTWAIAFIQGLFPLSFAEIISLLQKGNTLTYVTGVPVSESVTGVSVSDREWKPIAMSQPVARTKEKGARQFALDYRGAQLPFYLDSLLIKEYEKNDVTAQLRVQWAGVVKIKGILADIEIESLYGEKETVQDISFLNLQRRGDKDKALVSDETTCNIPYYLEGVKNVTLVVKKYAINDEVHLPGDNLSVPQQQASSAKPSNNSIGNGYGVNVETMLATMGEMRSSAEIFQYVKTLHSAGDPIVSEDLKEIVKTSAYTEKMYGNNYNSCMKKIYDLFGYEYISAKGDPHVGNYPNDSEDDHNLNSYSNTIQINDSLEPLYCSSCGKRIEEPDAIFCPSCGSMIDR